MHKTVKILANDIGLARNSSASPDEELDDDAVTVGRRGFYFVCNCVSLLHLGDLDR